MVKGEDLMLRYKNLRTFNFNGESLTGEQPRLYSMLKTRVEVDIYGSLDAICEIWQSTVPLLPLTFGVNMNTFPKEAIKYQDL